MKGWAFDPDAPTEDALDQRLRRRPGRPEGAVEYELGPVATLRGPTSPPVPAAGPKHGFDVSFATVKSGPQPICVYALNTGAGGDRLLGCKTTASRSRSPSPA